MEPREVLALYDGYEWRRRREAGTLAFLVGMIVNRLTPNDVVDVDRLVQTMESWEPEKPK
jgi:hypothetical protein